MSNLSTEDKIVKLQKQLLPTGRAFRAVADGNMDLLLRGLAKSKATLYDASVSFLDTLIPDNDNFSEENATEWEARLGLITNPATPLADRKAAILRKMGSPGPNPARGHYLYLQDQLQLAGFDVYVYENIFTISPGVFYSPDPLYVLPQGNIAQLGDAQLGDAQLGDVITFYNQYVTQAQCGDFQLGDFQLNGYTYNRKIANSINSDQDATFNLGDSFRSIFYIGGNPLGTFANVLASREAEFRHLVLSLKQTQNIAILFIKYI